MNLKNIRTTILFILLFLSVSALFLFWKNPSYFIIINIRIPRLYLALLSGMVLSGVGSGYQIIFNNPLAEPYILGISSGSALGSVLATIFGFYSLAPLFSFGLGLLTIFIVWTLAHIDGFFDKNKLLLSGIITGMFFSAIISLLMYLNLKEIRSIVNILMGNLGFIFTENEWRYFKILSLVIFAALFYLYTLSNQLNIISAGDLSATSLGINVNSLRKKVFITGSLLTGIVVAYSGIIGFVGLIVPHIVRRLIGSDQRKVFLYSITGGSILLILCDFLAMNLTVIEIPIGVITAFIGCPFFIYFMLRKKNR